VGTGGGARCPHTTEFVKHPMFRSIETLEMFLWTPGHR
jgi:hypothetical protein